MLRVIVVMGGDERVDICAEALGGEVIDYVNVMRGYGLTDDEIEEDLGGADIDQAVADKGLVDWACGCLFADVNTLEIYAPDTWTAADLEGGVVLGRYDE